YSAGFAGEDRLVILLVASISGPFACDIGWQRHLPGPLQQNLDRFVAIERQRPAAILVSAHCRRGHFGGKGDAVTFVKALAIADEGLPAANVEPLVQRGSDPRVPAPS